MGLIVPGIGKGEDGLLIGWIWLGRSQRKRDLPLQKKGDPSTGWLDGMF
jgi:hypothetical protein